MAEDNTKPQDDNQYDDISLEEQIEQLEKQVGSENEERSEIDELKIKLKEAEDKYLRAHADMSNIRERAQKDRGDAIRYALEPFAMSLMMPLDILEQALRFMPEEIAKDNWSQGMIQFEKLLEKALKENGLEKMEITLGKTEFDPNMHESVGTEDGKKDSITSVVQSGYTLNGKILRPAKVNVGG